MHKILIDTMQRESAQAEPLCVRCAGTAGRILRIASLQHRSEPFLCLSTYAEDGSYLESHLVPSDGVLFFDAGSSAARVAYRGEGRDLGRKLLHTMLLENALRRGT